MLTSMTSRALTLAAFATLLGTAACKTQVIGGEGGAGGTGGGMGTAGGGGGLVFGPPSAIAEYAYTQPQPDPGPTGTTSSGGGTGPDPSTLFVRISNAQPACGVSVSFPCGPETVWQVSIGIPPSMQSPGGVYALSDPNLISSFSEGGSNGTPGDCWGGGGTFWDGTLEVLSNDGATIVIRLSGTASGLGDFSVDGDWSAPICDTGLD